MDALVRVSAHFAGIDQMKGAPGLEPLVEEGAHESLAQLHFGRLVEPRLRHVQNQKAAGKTGENRELRQKPLETEVRGASRFASLLRMRGRTSGNRTSNCSCSVYGISGVPPGGDRKSTLSGLLRS